MNRVYVRSQILKYLLINLVLLSLQFMFTNLAANADNYFANSQGIQTNPNKPSITNKPTPVVSLNPALITSNTRLIIQYYSDPITWNSSKLNLAQLNGIKPSDRITNTLSLGGRELTKYRLGKDNKSFYGATWQFNNKKEAEAAFKELQSNPLVKNVSFDFARPLAKDAND